MKLAGWGMVAALVFASTLAWAGGSSSGRVRAECAPYDSGTLVGFLKNATNCKAESLTTGKGPGKYDKSEYRVLVAQCKINGGAVLKDLKIGLTDLFSNEEWRSIAALPREEKFNIAEAKKILPQDLKAALLKSYSRKTVCDNDYQYSDPDPSMKAKGGSAQ